MIAKKTLAAAVIALGALAAVPASAGSLTIQFGHGHPGYGWSAPGHGWGPGHGWHAQRHRMVSAQDVRRILSRDGYRNIRHLDRRGSVYQARASKNGRNYVIVVSARNGQILSRNRV